MPSQHSISVPKAAVGAATGMRHSLFAHIQTFSFTEMDTLGTSTLVTRMTSDINQVQNGINMVLRLFLRSPFIVFGAMIMAFTIDVKASTCICCGNPGTCTYRIRYHACNKTYVQKCTVRT